jgi:hypothetical protein
MLALCPPALVVAVTVCFAGDMPLTLLLLLLLLLQAV